MYSIFLLVLTVMILIFLEPQEAEVRSFRGIISGGVNKRFLGGFLKGAVNKIKSLFARKGKKVSTKKIKKKIEEMKLTGRPAKMPLLIAKPPTAKLTAKFSQWHTKLLSWDWRKFVKGYKFEGITVFAFIVVTP